MAERNPLDDMTVVLDASAMVDLLLGNEQSHAIAKFLRGRTVVAPAHFDVEVLSAIGRLCRSGDISDTDATIRTGRLAQSPIRRVPVAGLIEGAWARRHDTRLTDALYVELAASLDTVVVTTDVRLSRAHPSRTHQP